MSLRKLSRLTAPALLAAASAAMAEDTTQPTTLSSTTPSVPAYVFTLGADANYAFDTDFKNQDSSLSVFRSGGSVRMDHMIDETTSLSLTFNGEYTHYFFRNLAAVPGDDGSDSLDVYQVDLRPVVSHQFSENFSAFAGLSVTASGMSKATYGDSMTYGAFAGVNYQAAPKVWIGGGLSVVTQLEDNPFVVPLFTMKWEVTPDLTLASDGLGLRATYKLDDNWSLYARGRYEFRQYRLDGGEVISDGVLTDQSVPVSVGVTYQADRQLSISADLGMVAWRRVEFTTSGGNDAGADETDPALFASFQVRYSF